MLLPSFIPKIIRCKTKFRPKTDFVRCYSIWEPDYLIYAKTKTPEYDLINVQIKGFDFVVLENYQKIINRIAKMMALDVSNAWSAPHQDLKVQKFISNSSQVEHEYNLKVFERNLQVVDTKSHILPLFMEAIITACPPGFKVDFHQHTPEIEESRYVPDYEMLDLQKELDELKSKKK